MPDLLTLEEAARYLRVSKTSLRRWTNEGRLACVRVGRRGERRFRRGDLDVELARAPSASGARAAAASREEGADPEGALRPAAARGVPRHVSLHHSGRDELWRLFRPYLVPALRRGAPVLYVHEDGARRDVLGRVAAEGIDPAALVERGVLRLRVPSEAYLRTGAFSPDAMIDYMEAAILDFRALGHRAPLISGEMTWFLSGAPGVDGMIAYESRLNDLLRRHPEVTIVCHYDVDRLPGRITLGAVCTHPHVQLADRLERGLA
ncbi:MAG TPA: MEDS domain-containing protein [Anaeromyxobacteraceae bacterium]|nr:MEDS domain-containing protein [Anaeromyxobacteraceae bacterium]